MRSDSPPSSWYETPEQDYPFEDHLRKPYSPCPTCGMCQCAGRSDVDDSGPYMVVNWPGETCYCECSPCFECGKPVKKIDDDDLCKECLKNVYK